MDTISRLQHIRQIEIKFKINGIMHNILQRNRFAQRLRIGYKHRRPIRVTEISNKIFTDIHWSLAINQTIIYIGIIETRGNLLQSIDEQPPNNNLLTLIYKISNQLQSFFELRRFHIIQIKIFITLIRKNRSDGRFFMH